MNIIGKIGIKAARKISDLDVSDDAYYVLETGEIANADSSESNGFVSMKYMRHIVSQHNTVALYGSPGAAKNRLTEIDFDTQEAFLIKEALDYFS